jgi:Putative serine esterase (DUF676)
MKKILFAIGVCLLSFQSVQAQQVQLEETPPNWSLMLSNLNQSQITSGFLYNKVAMFTNLYDFNRGNYNLSHADHFKQAINELYYASEQTKFISSSQLRSTTATTPAGTIDVGIINSTITMLNFNEKDPSTGGLTFPVDRFVPISGRPAFLTRKILLASPLKESTSGTAVTYKFSNNLIFTNATTAIKTMVVYFDNATPVTIINNGSLVLVTKTVNYTTSGKKALKFVTTFTDNSTITTVGYHFFSYIAPITTSLTASSTTTNLVSPCNYEPRDRDTYKSTIAFQGYDEPVAYYGKFDRTVFYHTDNGNTHKKILKPIIIIDGFDPGDTRKTTDCDCEMDTSEGGCFEKYSKDNGGVFNSTEHESIEDNMYYDFAPNDRRNLINELRLLGYDVIILNIPTYNTSAEGSTIENKKIDGGADYVERNGRALASYLKSTKSTLLANGSNQDIVIMGPSMGGLISRYALAYMEKQFATTGDATWKHNTRLWVSFDSPHLGANIPVGAQANIWFFGEKLHNDSAKDKFDNQLNSIAGKQMLINQFSNTLATMSGNTGTSSNAPFYAQFQSNLNSNGVAGSVGFPTSTTTFRKIAIVNGSLNGVKNGTEGGEFLNVRGYKDPTILEGALAGAAVGGIFGGWGGIGFGAVVGGLLGASNANITVLRSKDNFYPAYGQTDYIFQGDGQNFNVGWQNWYINHKWYKLKGVNNDSRGSLDVVPAGTFTTGKILRDEIVKGVEDAGLSSEVRGTNIDTHSFIPTFSSLSHLNPYQNWSNPLNTNLACPSNKQTPFDSFFGATSNTPHISLTKEMVNWLLKELAGKPQAPWFPIQDNLIIGDNLVCDGQIETYSINDICKVPSSLFYNNENGVAVNGWSVQGNLQIISSTAYSVTIKGLGNESNDAKIIATFQNGQKIEKLVHVGVPSTNGFIPINGSYSWVPRGYSSNHAVSFPASSTSTSYKWTIELDNDVLGLGYNCNAVSNPYLARFNSISNGINNNALDMAVTTTQPYATWYSSTPNASINWGRCSGNYVLTVTGINDCGETSFSTKYVTVGSPASNPCQNNTTVTSSYRMIVSPNPIKTTETTINLTPNHMPCDESNMKPQINYKEIYGENYYVKLYDLNGVVKYSGEFVLREDEETFSFKVTNINLADNYYILEVRYPDNYKESQMVIINKE